MKKILLLLLLSIAGYGQTSTGQEQEFDYGIKNNALQTITTPTYIGTFGTDGTQGKIPSAYIAKTAAVQDSLNKKLNLPTGFLQGLALSINADPTKFNIAAGYYVVTDFSDLAQPVVKIINYAGATGLTPAYLATANSTYVALDINGAVVSSASPFTDAQRRTLAIVGNVVHSNNTTINVTNEIKAPIVAFGNQLHDFMRAIGFLNESGNIYSANGANLQINKSVGDIFGMGINAADYLSPHKLTIPSQNALTFAYRFQNGTQLADTQNINPNIYDVAGVSTPTPSNKWTIQRINLFQSGLSRIQPGQTVYNSFIDATTALPTQPFVTEQNIADNAVFRCYLIVQEGTTNLASAVASGTAQFVPVDKFGNIIGNGSVALTYANIIAALGYTPENVANKSDNYTSSSSTTYASTKALVDGLGTKNWIKSNEILSLAQRKGDVLYGILDQYTGEEITLSKVTGTPTVDGIIYFQLGAEYFKRDFEYSKPEWFGAVGILGTDDSEEIEKAIASSSKVLFSKIYYVSSPVFVKPGNTVIEGKTSSGYQDSGIICNSDFTYKTLGTEINTDFLPTKNIKSILYGNSDCTLTMKSLYFDCNLKADCVFRQISGYGLFNFHNLYAKKALLACFYINASEAPIFDKITATESNAGIILSAYKINESEVGSFLRGESLGSSIGSVNAIKINNSYITSNNYGIVINSSDNAAITGTYTAHNSIWGISANGSNISMTNCNGEADGTGRDYFSQTLGWQTQSTGTNITNSNLMSSNIDGFNFTASVPIFLYDSNVWIKSPYFFLNSIVNVSGGIIGSACKSNSYSTDTYPVELVGNSSVNREIAGNDAVFLLKQSRLTASGFAEYASNYDGKNLPKYFIIEIDTDEVFKPHNIEVSEKRANLMSTVFGDLIQRYFVYSKLNSLRNTQVFNNDIKSEIVILGLNKNYKNYLESSEFVQTGVGFIPEYYDALRYVETVNGINFYNRNNFQSIEIPVSTFKNEEFIKISGWIKKTANTTANERVSFYLIQGGSTIIYSLKNMPEPASNGDMIYYSQIFPLKHQGTSPDILSIYFSELTSNVLMSLPTIESVGSVREELNEKVRRTSGTTAQRPTFSNIEKGYIYYDTSLEKNIYWDGAAWSEPITTAASPAFTGTPTAPTATAGTNTTQIATTAFVQATRPYKIYSALISQTGTSAPTATILENTLGGTVVWTRTGVGAYLATLSGVFTANKTSVLVTPTSGSTIASASSSSVNDVNLSTALSTTAAAIDGVLTNATIEIRVYN